MKAPDRGNMRLERTDMLYQNMSQVISIVVGTSIPAVVLTTRAMTWHNLAVAAACLLAGAVRISLFPAYRNRRLAGELSDVELHSWSMAYGGASILLGVTLGFLTWTIFEGGVNSDKFLVMGVGLGYAAGIVLRVSSYPWISKLTCATVLGSISASCIFAGTEHFILAGVMVAIYFLSLLKSTRQAHEGIVEQVSANQEAVRLARYDTLTDLPNRSTFNEQLDRFIRSTTAHERGVAVIQVNMDRFKSVNDVFGYPVGDRLLVEVSRRLMTNIRTEDVLSRFGGDEFAVIVPNCGPVADVSLVAERILGSLAEPFNVDGQSIEVSASIGLSIFPDHGEHTTTLLNNADIALRKAKSEGRNRLWVFETSMHKALLDRRLLEQDLKVALERDELFLCYQPIVNAKTMEIEGFEALLRWKHPTRGLISPEVFIPIAEETGLIVKIGFWVAEMACTQAATWSKPMRVAVNISPMQFGQANFVQKIQDILLSTRLSPDCLEMEVTESMIIDSTDRAATILKGLRAIGVRVSLDDFGTGFSSLSYLRRFPFDKIKIDKSFVLTSTGDADARSIVASVVSLGHSLNMKVVAEGVETQEHVDMLRAMGCEQLQGYLFSKPVPIQDLSALIGSKRPFLSVLQGGKAA